MHDIVGDFDNTIFPGRCLYCWTFIDILFKIFLYLHCDFGDFDDDNIFWVMMMTSLSQCINGPSLDNPLFVGCDAWLPSADPWKSPTTSLFTFKVCLKMMMIMLMMVMMVLIKAIMVMLKIMMMMKRSVATQVESKKGRRDGRRHKNGCIC